MNNIEILLTGILFCLKIAICQNIKQGGKYSELMSLLMKHILEKIITIPKYQINAH